MEYVLCVLAVAKLQSDVWVGQAVAIATHQVFATQHLHRELPTTSQLPSATITRPATRGLAPEAGDYAAAFSTAAPTVPMACVFAEEVRL